MLTYKGYIGHVEFDDETAIFHGDVIKKAFRESVDDYLAFCEERNEEPERPFSGKFNLRLDPELHRQVYIAAKHHKMSLNQWITETIKHHVHE